MLTNQIRDRYNHLTSISKRRIEATVRRIQQEFNLSSDPVDVVCIALKPTPDQVRAFVKEHKLWCDRCGTDEFIIGEPSGLSFKGRLTNFVEYYCVNTVDSAVFSKCWNHVYSHDGRGHIFRVTNERNN